MTNPVKSEVVLYQASSLSNRAQYAQTLAGAADLIPRGLFDKQTGRPSPAKILLVMETGAMLGLAPMAAIAGIDVIEGKAAISPRVALGLFRSAGHKVKIIEEGTVETGDLKMTVILTRKDDPENPIPASFTVQQALRAGLIDSYTQDSATGFWKVLARSKPNQSGSGGGKVLPWEAYTEDMCLWRAVSRLGRRGGQDVLMGIGYIPEELETLVDEDGVRQEVYTKEDEDALIAEFKLLDDKEDMRAVWRREHPMKVASDNWTERVEAEFASHLSTLMKDRREDGKQQSDEDIQDADVVDDEPRADVTHVEVDGTVVAETRHVDAPVPDEDLPPEERSERAAREADEAAAAEWEREHAAKVAAAKPAPREVSVEEADEIARQEHRARRSMDMSALETPSES